MDTMWIILMVFSISGSTESESIRMFGMSMALTSSPSLELTICSPYLTHECSGNSYRNGICYKFKSSMSSASDISNTFNIFKIAAAFQEITKAKMNVVFLVDGSSSLSTGEFEEVKQLIWNIMTELKNTSIQFSAVQFSGISRTIFTFNDDLNAMAKEKLDKEIHMKSLTNTHRAIRFVLENHFNNVMSGADPEAIKALVIVTDGDPTDLKGTELEECDRQNIKRFVIGVGTRVSLTGLVGLASEPKTNNTFMIQDYAGLNSLLDKLQNKIYNIDGSTESESIRVFGMSMALTSSPSLELTICSPYLTHECSGNSYLNGICYKFKSLMSSASDISNTFNISKIAASFQEVTKAKMNLVFLVDGSASMTSEDFEKAKQFIWDIMTELKNTSIQFSAVQFSGFSRTIFTFNDYLNGMAKEKLDKEIHMKSLTNTHRAIRFVLENHFNNVMSGADPEAIKALVIITDGDPTDLKSTELEECDRQNIKRFVIGVGTRVSLTYLVGLASEPKTNNTFMIQDYAGLNSLLDKLQNKIYNIDGSTESESIRVFGMSMALTSSPSLELTICSPYLTHECSGNSYLNGICYKFKSSMSSASDISNTFNISKIAASFQEVTKAKMNLVFLVDGSSSMTSEDFEKAKQFIWDIMTELKNTSIQFSAVQFSGFSRTIFTFNDDLNAMAKEKLDKEIHMKSLTNTHRAIRFVLENHFNNVMSGADPEAIKALVIVTDGDPTDLKGTELEECDRQNIKRFVIGVGTRVSLTYLVGLASEPKKNNTFMIQDYAGLNSLLDKLQNKIYNTDGSTESESIRMFGMSMALTSSPSLELTICSPYLTHECSGNSYLNGICYKFKSSMSSASDISNTFNISKITAAFQEITKAKMNVVFLVDGSSSLSTGEFEEVKQLIWNIMTELKNTSIQFSAVQFSGFSRTIFTFNDDLNAMAKEKLDKEIHMKSLTNTHRAIRFVLENHFNNVMSGADPEAIKALVIITDGDPTDLKGTELEECDRQNIKRFVIGVGTRVSLTYLVGLASEPKTNNTFMIQDYAGLNSLLDKLQNKIYNIEGTKTGPSRIQEKELSQSGFSAAANHDLLILGAIGSNNWSGMLYEVTELEGGIREMEINDPELMHDSYQGYSVALGQRDGASLVFSGAPRSSHKGHVTLFTKTNCMWEVKERVNGEQIGSYFGASVCVLDLDLDRETDFLVIGAPTYYQAHPQREGQIYIYRIVPKLVKVLEVAESAQGRFATTVAPIEDLNGDKLQDLAVGAPLEDGGRGAIYIYLGNLTQGIRSHYSQRILAQAISEKLQQFGVAIDGTMDMGQDGLTDISVGARGAVILLKSRPVFSVSAELNFYPSHIGLTPLESLGSEAAFPILTLTICFNMTESTSSTDGVKTKLNVSYQLNTDPVREKRRVFFVMEDKRSRSLLKSELLDSERSCFNHTLYMLNCVMDTLSPVIIKLNFSQSVLQPENTRAMLNPDSRTLEYVKIPFQVNCRENNTCVADLQLDFTFQKDFLLVLDQSYFIIHVSLVNTGDDSFNTSLVLHYPPGLSLSKFETIKSNRCTLCICEDGALNKTTCSISSPVFHRDTHADFQALFHVSRFFDWNKMMEITLVASSENNNNTKSMVSKSLPVKFAVDVAISPDLENTVSYLSFSKEDKGPKPLIIVYKVRNLGVKGLPVTVNFTMPSQIQQIISLKDHSITSQDITGCNKEDPSHTADCVYGSCVTFQCRPFHLDSDTDVLFVLKALVHFHNPKNYTLLQYFYEFRMEEVFKVSAQLDFDNQLYHQCNTNRFDRLEISVLLDVLIVPDKKILLGAGIGGLVLLIILTVLLIKCGLSNRKHPCETGIDFGSDSNVRLIHMKMELNQ